MTDELDLEELDKDINNKNAVEDRIRNLNKGKKEAEDKLQAEAKARQEAEAKIVLAEKERDFYSSFSDSVAKNPAAAEYRDKIKEKVLSGYTTEDATISILHAEGKLTTPKAQENVAGGSAPNQINTSQTKTTTEMSSSERWAALAEAERRGDLGLQ